MLAKCYRIVRKLQVREAVPVDSHLVPIYNNLTTMRDCLGKLVKWKVSIGERELAPLQIKLACIDNLRVSVKMIIDAVFGKEWR